MFMSEHSIYSCTIFCLPEVPRFGVMFNKTSCFIIFGEIVNAFLENLFLGKCLYPG